MTKKILLALCLAGALNAQTSKMPINNGVLQSDLDAAGFKVLRANLSDYAGTNMSWNAVTNKFDAVAGGGVSQNAPFTLASSGDSGNPGAHPFTAANSGFFVNDATGREVFRMWASGSDMTGTMHNNLNLYIGYNAGLTQPSDNTTAGSDNVGVGARALVVNTTGSGNVAVGSNASQFNTTGFANVAVGSYALSDNNGGEGVTGVGANALKASKGGGNTGVGFGALFVLVDGNENVGVGRYSGSTSIHDNGGVFLGEFAQRDGDSGVALTNPIAIGYSAIVSASNTAVIGNNLLTDAYFGSTAGNAVLHGKGVIPVGGTTGQVLAKNSGTNFDASWSVVKANPFTVATLPGSPVVGQLAAVTDGTASLAWGATVTGGGTTKYFVWYNGTAWTVTGK